MDVLVFFQSYQSCVQILIHLVSLDRTFLSSYFSKSKTFMEIAICCDCESKTMFTVAKINNMCHDKTLKQFIKFLLLLQKSVSWSIWIKLQKFAAKVNLFRHYFIIYKNGFEYDTFIPEANSYNKDYHFFTRALKSSLKKLPWSPIQLLKKINIIYKHLYIRGGENKLVTNFHYQNWINKQTENVHGAIPSSNHRDPRKP